MAIGKIKEKFDAFRNKPLKKRITMLLPYVITSFFMSRTAELYRLCGKSLVRMAENYPYIYKTFPRFTLQELLGGITAGIFTIWFYKAYQKLHGKNERLGEEYGSARWGA